MSDPWKELADRYGGASVPDAPKDEWAALSEKHGSPAVSPSEQAPAKPIKIGKEAFADQLRSELRNADWMTRNLAGFGTAASNVWEGAKQFAGRGDEGKIAANRIIEQEAPAGAIAGNISMAAIPFGATGNSLKAAGLVGSAMGAFNPVDGEQTLENIAKGKALNAALGGATGIAGQWIPNKILSSAGSRLSAIEQKVKDKAAQVAASETASARSAAGNAAQNAYRQLEHINTLGANRALTAEEQIVKASLERELAEKSLENLLPAASLKQSTSEAYKEAMRTEADRAAEYAAAKLSNNEVKQQIMARVKRYGPAVAGGMVGNAIFPGLGGSVGGAATGLVLRPAIRSMINLSQNPAVQHGLLSPVANSAILKSSAIPASSFVLGEGLLGQ